MDAAPSIIEFTLIQAEPPHLASRLVITIEAMQVLPESQLEPVLAWLRGLDYPWTSAAAVSESAPDIEMIAPVLQYLGRKENGS